VTVEGGCQTKPPHEEHGHRPGQRGSAATWLLDLQGSSTSPCVHNGPLPLRAVASCDCFKVDGRETGAARLSSGALCNGRWKTVRCATNVSASGAQFKGVRLWLAALAATLTALWARNVSAQPNVTRAHAVVNAPCADEDSFWKRVGAHTVLVAKASAHEASVTLEVTVHADDESASGTFSIYDGADTAPTHERSVSGKTCDEVVDALSFFVALTYDPDAISSPPPSAPPPPPIPQRREQPESSPLNRPWIFTLGSAAQIAKMDDIPLGGSVLMQASRRFGRLEPAFRISLSTLTTRVQSSNVSARFVWLFVAPEVCPAKFTEGVWSISPCGGIALGVSTAAPSGVPGGRSFAGPWIAPRILARGAIALDRRISIELSSGIETPLLRRRFVFGPVPAYHFPAVVPFAMLGLSISLGGSG
jgi:hypothetical protein